MSAEIIFLADRRKRAPDPEAEEASILRLIQQIADNLGIDVEAPFRTKPGSRQQ